jgi:glycosyltransferase 2 family protein
MRKFRPNLSSLFGLLLLAVSIWAIAQELHEYNYHDILTYLAAIPKSQLSLSVWFTILSYLVLTLYDYLGFYYLGHPLSYNKVAFTNFVSSSFSNTVGFAIVTGSAIRYRFYSLWGVSAIEIAFENFTFWLGLFAVSGAIFVLDPLPIPTQLHLPFADVRPLGVIFVFMVFAYIVGSIISKQPLRIRGQEFRFPGFRLAVAQVLISSLDWIFTAAVLYVLIPAVAHLSFLDFLGIYLLAMTAGVVSNVPGGLGVFETVILVLLKPQVPPTVILGSMLAYRGVYYLLPLVVATGLLGFYEINARYPKG